MGSLNCPDSRMVHKNRAHADAFHEQDSTPRPCTIMGGTDMLILHTTTTSTPIGVHRGAMHGDPHHSPEDRASEANPPHH